MKGRMKRLLMALMVLTMVLSVASMPTFADHYWSNAATVSGAPSIPGLDVTYQFYYDVRRGSSYVKYEDNQYKLYCKGASGREETTYLYFKNVSKCPGKLTFNVHAYTEGAGTHRYEIDHDIKSQDNAKTDFSANVTIQPNDTVTVKLYSAHSWTSATMQIKNVQFTLQHTPGRTTTETKSVGDCMTDGKYIETVYCSVCDGVMSQTEKSSGKNTSIHTNLQPISAVAANCTQTGLTAGQKCEDCGAITISQQTVPISPNNHALEHVARVNATCIDSGKQEYWRCTRDGCGKLFSDAQGNTEVQAADLVIPATGHNMTETPALNATCTTDGTQGYFTCSRCSKVFADRQGNTETTVAARKIFALGHSYSFVGFNWAENKQSATASYNCTRTGCTFSDNNAAATVTHIENECVVPTCTATGKHVYSASALNYNLSNTAKAEVILPVDSNNHDWNINGTDSGTAGHVVTCKRNADHTKTVEHTFGEYANQNDETCTQMGSKAASCAYCSATVTQENVVPALTHVWSDWTDNHDGTHSRSCQRTNCDGVNAVETAAHSFTNYVYDNNASCIAKGTKTAVCDSCDATHTVDDPEHPMSDTLHVIVTDAAETSTCQKKGKTEGSHCSVCKTVIVAQKELDYAHVWNEGVETASPTCQAPGVRTFTCGTCGGTKTEPIAVVGHNPVSVEAVAATCTEHGKTAGTKCSMCGNVLSGCADTDPLDHDFGAWSKKDNNEHQRVCSRDASHVETQRHTPVAYGAKPATCTEAGAHAGQKCSVCDGILEEPAVIQAQGHSYTDWKSVSDEKHVGTCERCGETSAQQDHNWVNVELVPPTLEEEGSQRDVCADCGAENVTKLDKITVNANPGDRTFTSKATARVDRTVPELNLTVCVGQTGIQPLTSGASTNTEQEGWTTKRYAMYSVTCADQEAFEENGFSIKLNDGEAIGNNIKLYTSGDILKFSADKPFKTTLTIESNAEMDESNGFFGLGARKAVKFKAIINIEVVAHDYDKDNEKLIEASKVYCNQEGYQLSKCGNGTGCGTTYMHTLEIDPNAHDPAGAVRENVVDSTCSEAGSYDSVVYCKVCSDELSRETKGIDKKSHTPAAAVEENKVDATCTETGSYDSVVYCGVCNAEISRTEKTIALAAHTEATDEAKAPTCTEDGLTEGKHCSVCNATITAQQTVNKLGHDYASEVTTAATCAAKGVLTKTCKRDATHVTTEEIPLNPNNHTGETYVQNAVAATCTEEGYTGDTHCSGCDVKLESGAPVMPKHTEVDDKGYAATCSTDGLSDGKHCSVCGAVTVQQEVIPATGHSFSTSWSGDENEHWFAAVCGDTDEVSEKAAHSFELSSWKWIKVNGKYQVTLTVFCPVCNHVEVVENVHVETKSTDSIISTVEYTATTTVGGKEFTDTKKEVTAKGLLLTVESMVDTDGNRMSDPVTILDEEQHRYLDYVRLNDLVPAKAADGGEFLGWYEVKGEKLVRLSTKRNYSIYMTRSMTVRAVYAEPEVVVLEEILTNLALSTPDPVNALTDKRVTFTWSFPTNNPGEKYEVKEVGIYTAIGKDISKVNQELMLKINDKHVSTLTDLRGTYVLDATGMVGREDRYFVAMGYVIYTLNGVEQTPIYTSVNSMLVGSI